MSSSTLSQLLQRTPPASLTAEHEAHLLNCGSLFDLMVVALEAEEGAVQLRLLEAVLQQQAVRSAGTLVAWVQQQPEQLLTVNSVTSFTAATGSSALRCWTSGVQFLTRAAAKAGAQDYGSAATCQMAADMMQQLDQSGERCSLNCCMMCDALARPQTRSDYCRQQAS
jgi:hypothetical protein